MPAGGYVRVAGSIDVTVSVGQNGMVNGFEEVGRILLAMMSFV